MKYIKLFEANKWIDLSINYSHEVVDSAIYQNSDVNIEDVKDVLLDLFDELGCYLEPTINLYFLKSQEKDDKKRFNLRVSKHDVEYDPSESNMAKQDFLYARKFLATEKYNDPILNITFNTWSEFEKFNDNYDRWSEFDKSISERLRTPKAQQALKECYDRLERMGYYKDGSIQSDSGHHDMFSVSRKIKYTHKQNLEKYKDLPTKIVSDFNKFILSKNLKEKDVDELINIFKKGYEV